MRSELRFNVGERANVDVDVAAGTLELHVGPVGIICVSFDVANDDDLSITQIGDTVSIVEKSRWISRGRQSRIVVQVPHRSDLSVKAASLDVITRGPLGSVRCRSASGDVEVDVVDRIDVSTASGDVRVGTVNGNAGFNTTSGEIKVRALSGRLTAQLTSGDLAADVVGAGVQVGTASGDVRIGRCDGSDIQIKTVSGRIRLGLPAGIRVDPEIATMSGKVSLPKPAPSLIEPSAERRSVRVRLRSVSGDIRIDRITPI